MDSESASGSRRGMVDGRLRSCGLCNIVIDLCMTVVLAMGLLGATRREAVAESAASSLGIANTFARDCRMDCRGRGASANNVKFAVVSGSANNVKFAVVSGIG